MQLLTAIFDDIQNVIGTKNNPSHEKGVGNKEKLLLWSSYVWWHLNYGGYQNQSFTWEGYRKKGRVASMRLVLWMSVKMS